MNMAFCMGHQILTLRLANLRQSFRMTSGPIPPPPAAPGQYPPPQPYGYAQPPQPGWFRRNRKWFIPTLIIGVLALIAAFVGGLLLFVMTVMKSNEPYRHALEVVTQDRRAQAQLGKPVTAGFFVSGSVNVSGPSGNADLAIPVKGPLGSGTVYVVAKKSAGRWSYQTLELRMEGQPDLDLLPATRNNAPSDQEQP